MATDSFNPYRTWLGVETWDKPTYYELLKLSDLETDPQLIADAADKAMARVRGHRPGANSGAWSALLDEIQSAKDCLLDVRRREAYNRDIAARLATAPPSGSRSTRGAATTQGIASSAGSMSGPSSFPSADMLPPGVAISAKTSPDPWDVTYPPQPASTATIESTSSAKGAPAQAFPSSTSLMPPTGPTLRPAPAAQPVVAQVANSAMPSPTISGYGQPAMAPMSPQFSPSPQTANMPMSPSGYGALPPGPSTMGMAPGPMNPMQPMSPTSAAMSPLSPPGATPQWNQPPAYGSPMSPMAGQANPYGQPGVGGPWGSPAMAPVAPMSMGPSGAPNPMAPMNYAPAPAMPYSAPVPNPYAAMPGPMMANPYGAGPMSPAMPSGPHLSAPQLPAAGVAPMATAVSAPATPASGEGALRVSRPLRKKNSSMAAIVTILVSVVGIGIGVILILVSNTNQLQLTPVANNPVVPGPPPTPSIPPPTHDTKKTPEMKTPVQPPSKMEPKNEREPERKAPKRNPPNEEIKPRRPIGDKPVDPDGDNMKMGMKPETKPEMKPEEKPAEPPAMAGPTPAQLKDLTATVQKARDALGDFTFDEAEAAIAKAKSLAKLPAHAAKIERLRLLADLAKQFRAAIERTLTSLQSGDTVKVGNSTEAVIVEASREKLTIKLNGQNRTYSINSLPIGLAANLGDKSLKANDPAAKLAKGAYVFVDKNSDAAKRNQAKAWWEEAQLQGAAIGDLMQVFNDTYDFEKEGGN